MTAVTWSHGRMQSNTHWKKENRVKLQMGSHVRSIWFHPDAAFKDQFTSVRPSGQPLLRRLTRAPRAHSPRAHRRFGSTRRTWKTNRFGGLDFTHTHPPSPPKKTSFFFQFVTHRLTGSAWTFWSIFFYAAHWRRRMWLLRLFKGSRCGPGVDFVQGTPRVTLRSWYEERKEEEKQEKKESFVGGARQKCRKKKKSAALGEEGRKETKVRLDFACMLTQAWCSVHRARWIF